MVGTALAVIIPEGVRSLVVESGAHANNVVSNALAEETHKHDQEHALSVIGYCLILGFIFMLIVDQVSEKNFQGPYLQKKLGDGKFKTVYSSLDSNK